MSVKFILSWIVFGIVVSRSVATTLEPAGKDIGAVQFDSIIRLNAQSCSRPMLLFARYWVASNYYHFSIIWAEPHGSDMCFPIYPPTLSIGSDSNAFYVNHQLYPTNNAVYRKPLEARGAFRNMSGTYPIQNIRFAEKEAVHARLYATNVDRISPATHKLQFPLEQTVSETNRPTIAKVILNNGRADLIELLNEKTQVIKSVKYKFPTKDAPRLHSIALGEEPMVVGFVGEGLRVSLSNETYRFPEITLTHRLGGREGTVMYPVNQIGRQSAELPSFVEIHGISNNVPLRSATLTGYLKTSFSGEQAKSAASAFAAFSPPLLEYRRLLLKYWRSSPDGVSASDIKIIKTLRDGFEKDRAENKTLGEQLRGENVLMELNRLLGDTSELARHYELYLSILSRNGLFEMVLFGGSCAIETSMLWSRINECNVLLAQWLRFASSIDTANVKRFALDQLSKGKYWTSLELLAKCSSSAVLSVGEKFELTALECQSAERLFAFMASKSDPNNFFIKSQADWVRSSTTPAEIKVLILSSGEGATQWFKQLTKPTPEQTVLMDQVGSILKDRFQTEE
jgi:hypothetical protein